DRNSSRPFPIAFQHWSRNWGRRPAGGGTAWIPTPAIQKYDLRLRMAMSPGRLPQAVLMPDGAAWHQREMSIKMMQ
ncbi:hypothetical protein BTH59_09185, partial [Lactobacillus delbrueckii subsp. bulgaricus]|nr:hypothetical protein [Lactobacillus delbrueckii subsp. bulgaricus]